jgi:NAD(P)-dependent dehydrogenase (short-subunit alcohol dehydrogenase family)
MRCGRDAAAASTVKIGIVLLRKAMAIDHGHKGIRVNCIAPGTSLPLLPKTPASAARNEEYPAAATSSGTVGIRRDTKSQLFLASDDSSFMTEQLW